ncbi:hypothetical protein D047_2753B, partial [Vibrio parahaemolyticus VPTS-2010_2]
QVRSNCVTENGMMLLAIFSRAFSSKNGCQPRAKIQRLRSSSNPV